MSNHLDRATADARKMLDAVNAAGGHGQKAAEEALSAFTKVVDRARDNLETLLAQARPYVRQAKPYLRDARDYVEKSRRHMSGRDHDRPIVLALASVGAVALLALLMTPRPSDVSTVSPQPKA
jgi:alpha-beta hydrolase superfamily lysophospholipase